MIIDFKYHLFTITVIFIALGIGILLGSSIIGQDGLVEEQKKIILNIGNEIESLREKNNSFKNEISTLNNKLKLHKKIEEGIFSNRFKNLISGNNYLIVTQENKELELNYFEDLGVSFTFISDINNLNELKKNKYNKIIVWNFKLDNKYLDILREKFKKNLIVSKGGEFIYLMLAFLESE